MIKIIAPGSIKEKYIKDGINDYLERINHYHKIEIIEVKESKSSDPLISKKEEGIEILSKIKDEYVICLDLKGEMIDSVNLSKRIEKIFSNSSTNITFIIGGSNGIDDSVLKRANFKLSFSYLTFPHQLFRMILLEQIYRAFKIMNNETYHK